MKYYLYRLQKEALAEVKDQSKLSIDFIPPDCASIKNTDTVLVYVSQTLEILGIYEKKDMTLIQNTASNDITLRDIWDAFDFVKEVTPSTSRLFKKKMREITEQEFEKVKRKIA